MRNKSTWGCRTFREAAGVAVHLQRVEGADLQLSVVVQELLHDGFEGQQQLLLLLQLLLGGGCQLVVALHHAQLLGDVLEETGTDATRSQSFVLPIETWSCSGLKRTLS